MSTVKGFCVSLTKSWLLKESSAIKRKFQRLFPPSAQEITVFFDDETTPHLKSYALYESTPRKRIICNLHQRFRKHQAMVGVWVEVIVEETGYRLVSRKRTEEESRHSKKLQKAETEEQTQKVLRKLAQMQWPSPRCTALVITNSERRPTYQVLSTLSVTMTTLFALCSLSILARYAMLH